MNLHRLVSVLVCTTLLAACQIPAGTSPSSSKDLLAFSFASASVAGTVGAGAVEVNVPLNTNPSTLVASFTTSGNSVTVGGIPQTSGVTVQDFTNPVVYVVTAADGSTHQYTVTVDLGIVTTLAGSGAAGSIDGVGANASFQGPSRLVVNTSGDLFVVDTTNHKIRKVTATGTVTTLAGSGVSGYTNAAPLASTFSYPQGLDLDFVGSLYVADSNNNVIREVATTGNVVTVVGSGAMGSANGASLSATFDTPTDLAIDSSGYLYVADPVYNQIRVRDGSGAVTTFAGSGIAGSSDGTGVGAQFFNPQGVATDSSGNVYVADTNNHLIRKITPGGVVSTLAGSTAGSLDGTGSAARFNSPTDVAVDASGNVYVADSGNNKIRKITSAGVVTTIAGQGPSGFVNGPGRLATFDSPVGVGVDSAGNVYVGDRNNNAIRKIH